jgi:ubiquinone biosynthesis protein UbiJ
LSRLVGDRVAHRVGEAARAGARQADDLRGRVETGVRQFLVQEDRQLVGREDITRLQDALNGLEAAVARMEARLGSPPARGAA